MTTLKSLSYPRGRTARYDGLSQCHSLQNGHRESFVEGRMNEHIHLLAYILQHLFVRKLADKGHTMIELVLPSPAMSRAVRLIVRPYHDQPGLRCGHQNALKGLESCGRILSSRPSL